MSAFDCLRAATCFASVFVGAVTAAGDDRVSVTESSDEQSVRVTIDGELFAVVQRSERWKKPFLYPVLRAGWSNEPWSSGWGIVVADSPVTDADGAATGEVILAAARVAVLGRSGDRFHVPDHGGYIAADDIVPETAMVVRTMEDDPMPYVRKNKRAYDHPHHRGVWISVDEVNGLKFWNEGGVIRPDKLEVTNNDVAGNKVILTNSWLTPEGAPLVEEFTIFEFLPSRLILADITFRNVSSGDVTFADTKEGLFGIRLAQELRERETGTVRDAEGRVGEPAVWGQENRWVDYTGLRDGKPAGVTLFDSADNSRASRYHVRGYGLFSISPFGPHAYSKRTVPENPMVLVPDQATGFRYGLWVHGTASMAEIEKTAAQMAQYFNAAHGDH